MYRMTIAATIVALWVFCGCGTVPSGDPLPSNTVDPLAGEPPLAGCLSAYRVEELGAGFTPPSWLVGPVVVHPELTYFWAEWRQSDDPNNWDCSFASFPATMTLEEQASLTAQATAAYGTIFKNERIVLLSGQEAWLIASKDNVYPDDIMRVDVQLLRNGRFYMLALDGLTSEGSYDFDLLLAVGKTLCAD